MIADRRLNFCDRSPEARKVALGQGRQRQHHRKPAEMGGKRGRKRWQGGKGGELLLPVNSFAGGIEDEKDAPLRGERQASDHRSKKAYRAVPAVKRDATLQEEGAAQSGALAAAEGKSVGRRIERKSVQMSEPGGNCKRELRPGSQSRMRGNGLLDNEAMAAGQAEAPKGDLEMTRRTLGLRPSDGNPPITRELDTELRFIERQSETAETAAKAAVQVKKSEVQSRRCRNRHAAPHAESSRDITAEADCLVVLVPALCSSTGFLGTVAERSEAINDERTKG
jgi:hypothetical protein